MREPDHRTCTSKFQRPSSRPRMYTELAEIPVPAGGSFVAGHDSELRLVLVPYPYSLLALQVWNCCTAFEIIP